MIDFDNAINVTAVTGEHEKLNMPEDEDTGAPVNSNETEGGYIDN